MWKANAAVIVWDECDAEVRDLLDLAEQMKLSVHFIGLPGSNPRGWYWRCRNRGECEPAGLNYTGGAQGCYFVPSSIKPSNRRTILHDSISPLSLVATRLWCTSVIKEVHSMGTAIQLSGFTVWGLVVEVGRGVRMRLSVDDWERLSLNRGQRIRVKIPNRFDAWLIVSDLAEVPPVVWIMLTYGVCTVQTTPVIARGWSSGRPQGQRGNLRAFARL
jgi:hypothetical protein